MTDMRDVNRQRGYSTFLRRFNALLVDAVVLVIWFVGLITLITIFEWELLTNVATGLAVVGVILYDPVLVAARGGTIGHYKFNIRVVDAATGGRVGLLRALLRALLKAVAGIFSFFFMLVTRRHQALHDLATRSVVIIADVSAVPAHDVLYERGDAEEVRVPIWRRVIAIVGYSTVAFFGYALLSSMSLSEECLLNDICTARDDMTSNVAGWAMIVTFGVLMVLGWRGKLPGARHAHTQPDRVGASDEQREPGGESNVT